MYALMQMQAYAYVNVFSNWYMLLYIYLHACTYTVGSKSPKSLNWKILCFVFACVVFVNMLSLKNRCLFLRLTTSVIILLHVNESSSRFKVSLLLCFLT